MPPPCSPMRQPPTSAQKIESILSGCFGSFQLAQLADAEHQHWVHVAVVIMQDSGDPITDRLANCGAAKIKIMLSVEHRLHKGLGAFTVSSLLDQD